MLSRLLVALAALLTLPWLAVRAGGAGVLP